MRVSVQENVDIIRRLIRWNVLQSEFQTASHEIDDKRPFKIAVAISTHKSDARSDRAQLVKDRLRANVAKMPDFIGVLGHFTHGVREPIVRVRENKDAPRFLQFRVFRHVVLPTHSSRKYRRACEENTSPVRGVFFGRRDENRYC